MVAGHGGRRSYTSAIAVFQSLDFVSVPAADVDAAAASSTDVVGAELRWKVRGMGAAEAAAHFDGSIDQ